MKQRFLLILFLMAALVGRAAIVDKKGGVVTIHPDGGQAKVVCLEVVNDRIIRVRATSKDQLPQKPQSLIIVPQSAPAKGSYGITDNDGYVEVKTHAVKAIVRKSDGRIVFFDGNGQQLLAEVDDGKQFWDFTVPERELGIKGGVQPTEQQRHGLTWRMLFNSPDDEAFYGLGQHQSEQFNMKGKNEDLFQYNTKVSVPFVLSNKNYGLLWDSYSYCRFGNPEEYLQLGGLFKLYDKQGREGHLTGTYVDRNGKRLIREEDSIYYEFDCPATSEIANRTEPGGIKNLPKGFRLNGSTVVYEGFIEPMDNGSAANNYQLSIVNYQFLLYYAGYIKVYIGGREVVPERWRTAWNPNTVSSCV